MSKPVSVQTKIRYGVSSQAYTKTISEAVLMASAAAETRKEEMFSDKIRRQVGALVGSLVRGAVQEEVFDE